MNRRIYALQRRIELAEQHSVASAQQPTPPVLPQPPAQYVWQQAYPMPPVPTAPPAPYYAGNRVI